MILHNIELGGSNDLFLARYDFLCCFHKKKKKKIQKKIQKKKNERGNTIQVDEI